SLHWAIRQDLSASCLDQFGILSGDEAIVHDSGAWYIQRGNARTVRLEFPQLLDPDHRKSGDTVRRASALQFLEPGQLGLIGRNHDFSANLVRDSLLPAELHHSLSASDAVLRFQGSRFVVNAGVNHAAVVARLMAGHSRLFLQYDHTDSRFS